MMGRVLIVWLLSGVVALAGAEEDWSRVVALDEGPETEFRSREEAREVTLRHLARQEAAVTEFLKSHPDSPNTVDAQLRLARIFMVRGDLSENPELVGRAFQTLDELEAAPELPAERRADVAFARLSLEMHRAQEDVAAARDALVRKAEQFAEAFPGDRRAARLYVTLSEVFDDDPEKKRSLLRRAHPLAKDAGLKMQIADDLKRIDMLGKPVNLEFESMAGETIDVAALRGKVVVLVFFADWSPPSVMALARVEELARKFPPYHVRTLGVNLDPRLETATALMEKFDILWPVFWDGQGWESPVVRRLGINALPTVWVLDRRGRLRALNAPEDPTPLVERLIREQ